MNGVEEIHLGDVVQMRKMHPCGSDQWTVFRTGADIKIRCLGCGRIVMMDRETFIKRRRRVVSRPAPGEEVKGEPVDGRQTSGGIPGAEG